MTERPTVEVFADILCPFTHVGLRRFVAARRRRGVDVAMRVKAWPLEVVNGAPLAADFIADEVDEIRSQVAEDLFTGFAPSSFPATSLGALALASAAYERDLTAGEAVSLELRSLVFETGWDVSRPDVLGFVAARHGLDVPADDSAVTAEYDEGRRRGVKGSPHFFVQGGGFFCPSLDIKRDRSGHLNVDIDQAGWETFLAEALDIGIPPTTM